MTRSSSAAVGTLGVLAAAGAGALVWGTLVERNLFTVRHENVPVLDPAARPIRVLHMSDLHMAPWQTRKQDWVRSLVDLEPDLVINTGDNLGHVDGLIGVRRALEPFAGIPGVFVNGSNDYYGPQAKNPFKYFGGPSQHAAKAPTLDTDALEAFFEDELGWISLNNDVTSLEIGGSHLEFFGVNDAHRGWDRLELIPGALDAMREESDDEFVDRETVTVGVTHAPYRSVLDSFVTNGADVIFGGHTHGGQVRIPGMKDALVANCDIPKHQARGLSVWNHARRAAWLNVSAGLGTSIYAPVRFACRPEASLVTLEPSDIGYS